MTNVVPLQQSSPAEEAAAWVVRIDAGPLSAAERAELDRWLASDPRRADLLDEHARAWALAATAKPSAHPRARVVRRTWYLAGTAVAASIFVFAALSPLSRNEGFDGHYATAVGEQRAVALPDGSRIMLNTGSEVRVAFGNEARRVELARGEAFFTVAHESGRPFEVAAADTVTRAVGTRFVVRMIDRTRISVVVTEGRVELRGRSSAQREERLRLAAIAAGQGATTDGRALSVGPLATTQVERATGWMTGGVAFRDERLADVLVEINRYAARPVRLSDPALGELRISGYFAAPNVAGFIEGLSLTAGLRARSEPDGGIVMEAG